jgi:hypothetical protein
MNKTLEKTLLENVPIARKKNYYDSKRSMLKERRLREITVMYDWSKPASERAADQFVDALFMELDEETFYDQEMLGIIDLGDRYEKLQILLGETWQEAFD